MLKWIIGILVVVLLLRRTSVPNSVTTANGAPPEGNIDSWSNLGARTVGLPDSPSFYRRGAVETQSRTSTPVPPVCTAPTVDNFRTRGFYSKSYVIPGRS